MRSTIVTALTLVVALGGPAWGQEAKEGETVVEPEKPAESPAKPEGKPEAVADEAYELKLRNLAKLEEMKIKGEQGSLAEEEADLKKKLGAKKAMQELNAQFLGDAGAAFNHDDVQALLVGSLALRGKQRSLGVDFKSVSTDD